MKVVHCKKALYTHYIGRPSIFGNPFEIGRDGTRAEVIQKYREWVKNRPDVLKAIESLPADATLGCWCAPKPCHGHVIIEIWHEIHD